MIRILTKKESEFLEELSVLIEKYDVLFSTEKQGEINITVYDGDEDKIDLIRTSIFFKTNFDESDIKDLLEKTKESLKQLEIAERETHILTI